ncbi:exocyst complex component 3-like [Triplophysa rosa]|uniref:exocyst complex component 3-like n=1 Tax=Triplophysa rosa TaxID=992332 RepID=UPI00254618A1|nr:exocyst complex component 3-like [Triplophysa rosa]
MIEKWGQLNGVTIDKKEGSYSEDWLCELKQLIDESVKRHFPILPEDETQTSEQLEEFENIICSEMRRLTPVLKDAGLLTYLTDSYSRQLFIKLDLIVNRDLSENETFCLLLWGKRVFFSSDAFIMNDIQRHDPLLFTGWFERAKQKLLTVLKDDISKYLQNILCNEEKHEDNELLMDEEWFIRVHLDVTQCLDAAIKKTEICSLTLKNSVQILCLEELRSFSQKYVDGEKLRLEDMQSLETNFVYLCRIISTCMKLNCFAVQICNVDNNEAPAILKMLEDQVLSVVQKMINDLAQVSIKSSFKNGNEQIYKPMEEIRKLCASLPQIAAAEEIKTIIVNLAYDSVSRVYLDCLMESNFKRLERRWGKVEEKIRQHMIHFQDKFAQMNCSVEQNQLLERMSEVLFCSDVDALKLTCATLFKDFPDESEHYLPRLLGWMKTLSKRQVREVLDVARLGCQNPDNHPHFLMCLCCHSW